MAKKKKNKWARRLPFLIIFIVGLGLVFYPLISRLYYRVEATREVSDFQEAKEALDPEELARRMGEARAFNDSLANVISEDPYADDKASRGRARYAEMLELREKMGHVQIPRIDINIPIYAGTSDEVLQKGAGHLEGTSLPIGGNSSHTVITAHAGLPKARLFTDLKDLQVGDKFYIHNIEGILAYQVDHIDVIEPSDFSQLLIVPGHDYATLLTCTPIMVNSHRLIVRGHRVDYIPAVDEAEIAQQEEAFRYKVMFFAALVIILILLIVIFRLRRKKRQLEQKMALNQVQDSQDHEPDSGGGDHD